MAIETLPPSPAGEISHGAVRQKVNETIEVLNSGGISVRASWLAIGTPPEYQLCAVNDVPQAIAFTAVTLEVPGNVVSLDTALGEFTFLIDINNADISISIQVARLQAGAATALWGVYFQIWDGVSAWIDIPDSTRYLSFSKDVAGELQNLSYVARTGSIGAGTIYRVVQICSDVSKDVGIVSSKPFTNAPISAGIILSIGN